MVSWRDSTDVREIFHLLRIGPAALNKAWLYATFNFG
jgi:hypothetical protein